MERYVSSSCRLIQAPQNVCSVDKWVGAVEFGGNAYGLRIARMRSRLYNHPSSSLGQSMSHWSNITTPDQRAFFNFVIRREKKFFDEGEGE